MCTDLRAKILKTAGELFFKFGIRSVSIDDICNELHISKKTFYTVFKQKDELVAELLDVIRVKKEKDYRAVIEQDCNVLDMLAQNFRKLRSHSIEKHMAFGFDLEKFYPEMWHSHLAEMKSIDQKYTTQMLQKGIAQGMYRTDLNVEATAVLISNMVPFFMKDLQPLQMNMTQRLDYTLDVLLRILCSEEGVRYYQSTIQIGTGNS